MDKNKIQIKELDLGFLMDNGAPEPFVFSNEKNLYLFFHKENQNDNEWVMLSFKNYFLFKFGLPREDSEHPYSKYGLSGYGVFETNQSPWIDELKSINKNDQAYLKYGWNKLKHHIIPFHDSTFECISEGFDFKEVKGKIKDIISKLI